MAAMKLNPATWGELDQLATGLLKDTVFLAKVQGFPCAFGRSVMTCYLERQGNSKLPDNNSAYLYVALMNELSKTGKMPGGWKNQTTNYKIFAMHSKYTGTETLEYYPFMRWCEDRKINSEGEPHKFVDQLNELTSKTEHSKPIKETPMALIQTNDSTPVETKTFVFGNDVEAMSKDQLLDALSKLEQQKTDFKSYKTKSSYITNQIESINSSIKQVVELLDA
jgi:hypothetical protein